MLGCNYIGLLLDADNAESTLSASWLVNFRITFWSIFGHVKIRKTSLRFYSPNAFSRRNSKLEGCHLRIVPWYGSTDFEHMDKLTVWMVVTLTSCTMEGLSLNITSYWPNKLSKILEIQYKYRRHHKFW